MKVKKGQVSLAFRLWVLATRVRLSRSWSAGKSPPGPSWAAALALWWRSLPDDPPEPPPRLPYQHLYERPRDEK